MPASVRPVFPVLPVFTERTSAASPVSSSMRSFWGVSDQLRTEEIRMKILLSE